jgi:hypothetical protein
MLLGQTYTHEIDDKKRKEYYDELYKQRDIWWKQMKDAERKYREKMQNIS